MSIKIEGGGAAENVIKAGTSNQLLYNDKEILLKENFGLLPPDLSKKQDWTLADIQISTGNKINNPFTVPEDGWILSFICLASSGVYSTIDGVGSFETTPSQKRLNIPGTALENIITGLHCPYPVKKGQVVESSEVAPSVTIIFAPCMSV